MDLELMAVQSFSNVAAVDIREAQEILDSTGVEAQDFETEDLRKLWSVLELLVRSSRVPDFFAVQSKTGIASDRLQVALLSNEAGTPASERLLLVRQRAARRRAIRAVETVHKLLHDPSVELATAIGETINVLQAIAAMEQVARPLDGAVTGFLDNLDRVARGEREPTLATGLTGLDAVIGGLDPTLITIGALPGVGKSALLAGIIRNLATRSVRVGLFSLEDESDWLIRRLTSEATGIPVFVLKKHRLLPGQLERVQDRMPKVHELLGQVIVDERTLGPSEIVASTRHMITHHGVRAILIDHLGEVKIERTDRHDLDIANALQQLRGLSKTYRIPVVVACHLKRRDGLTPASEPKLTDFAFSAAVERMTRIGLGLSRPKEDNTLRVSVLKQTEGMSDVNVDLEMNKASALVVDTPAPQIRETMDMFYGAQEKPDGTDKH